ncbi:MAG: type VII toxin-antitoxin system HepT family RNase toxin [Pseudonocardia sp.]
MTPRPLDTRGVQAKLQLMSTLRARLDRFGEIERVVLEDDLDQRLILERLLTQLVDLAVAINTQIVAAETGAAPEDYRTSFSALASVGTIDADLARRLAPATGLRNVLIHAYQDLDMDRFVSSVPLARVQFAAYIRQVARWLTDRPPAG